MLLIALYVDKCVRYSRKFQNALADGIFQERSMNWDVYFGYVLFYSIWRRELNSSVSDGPSYQHAAVLCALEEYFPRECWELYCKLDRIFALLQLTFEFTNCSIRPWFCWYVLADLCFKLRTHLWIIQLGAEAVAIVSLFLPKDCVKFKYLPLKRIARISFN